MIELKKEVIKYAQKLNSTNLSPLRSGNVSVRATQDGVEGFLLESKHSQLRKRERSNSGVLCSRLF